MKPFVSIIIPVYNVENYLSQCLNSVINQTLKNIEIICVNDGSTDGSQQILEKYANLDSRIKVINKKNSGYGHTMNIGFDNATADYIGIVESDDFIVENMYEILYDKAFNHDLDFVKSEYNYVYDCTCDGYDMRPYSPFKDLHIYDQVINLNELQIGNISKYESNRAIWCGLYKKDFIKKNDIRFNESPGASYQDTAFNFITMIVAKRCMLLNDKLYCYRRTNPLSSVHNKQKLYDVLNEYNFVYDFLFNKNLIASKTDSLLSLHCVDVNLAQFYRIDISLFEEMAFLIKNYIKEKNLLAYSLEIELLINDTEKFIEDKKYIKEKQCSSNKKLRNLLHSNKEIIVFGAGILGTVLFDSIGVLGCLNQVKYYAVTENKDKRANFNGIKLEEISALAQTEKDTPIIIASKGINAVEMDNTARKLGFSKIHSIYEMI